MNNGFIFSKRLLYATIFSVVVVGGAFYYSQKEPATSQNKINQPKPTEQDTLINNATVQTDTINTTHVINTATATSTAEQILESDVNLTKTDILTRNLLKPYLEQSNNKTYSKENNVDIVANATKQMFLLEYTPLKPDVILTSADTSTDAATIYKENLYSSLKPIFDLEEYELTIYARAIRDNSKKDFDSLISIANVYTKAADDTLKQTAPNDVSAVHLAIVNSLYKFATVLNTLAKGYDDPAASLAGTGNFTQAEEDIQHAFDQLRTYFILKGVSETVN